MSDWKPVSTFIKFTTKGITPSYVDNSTIIVLNQKCIRNNRIDLSLAQFTDDSKEISETKFVKKGDILVNSTGAGTAGRSAFVTELPQEHRLIVDSHILILRCYSYSAAQCLSYSLYSFEKTLMSFMTGSSGQSELDKVVLLNLKTIIPSDSKIQQKIASVLSSFDSKIELNNRINAELEAMAKMLYDYWFVQFDFPDKNDKPYKTSGGTMIWNEELKREIPEGWEVQHLSNIANITTGKLDSNAEVIGAKYPFYTCASEPSTTDSFAFDDTVILIAGNNAAGNFHINRHKGKFNAYQRTYIVTAKKSIELEYLYQVLKTETKSLKSQGKGSQTKFLTIGMLTGLKTFVNTGLMERYNRIVNPIYEQQVIIRSQNQQLSELRDWLLPMLMNGQVVVGESKESKASYKIEEEMRMAAEPGNELK